MLRSAASLATRTPGAGALVSALELLHRPGPHRLAVLAYHRVTEEQGPPGLVSAHPAQFARQATHLCAKANVVGLDAVLAARRNEAVLPPRAVLITFDDGYEDFAEQAWPILREHGAPATLFVPTAFPDRGGPGFWWDRLHGALAAARTPLATPLGILPLGTPRERLDAYRRLREHLKSLPHAAATALVEQLLEDLPPPPRPPRVLGWDELRRLAAEGVTVAPHTRTHPLLSRVSRDEAREEAAGSLADLERELGSAPPALAYPAGGISPEAREAVAEAGILLGFAGAGVNDLERADWLALRRIAVGSRTSLPVLRARLVAPARPVHPPPPPAGRVAYVMSRFPKLSETFVLYEVLALQRLGVDVQIYPLLREREPRMHAEAAALTARAHFFPFLSGAILRSNLALALRRPRRYSGALWTALRGTWGSANFFVGAVGIFPKVAHAARQMERDGVTHVHCHFANHPALAGLIVRRLTGIPYSFTAHGSDLHVDRTMLERKVAEAAFVTTVSEDNRRLIVAECGGRHAEKVRVVRAGVDTGVFRPRAETAAGRPLEIVCIGTLHEVKGQTHLVEACRRLAAADVAFRCRLVGDGPDAEALRRQIAAAGLQGAVRLVGPQTRAEIASLLAGADVLVAPSVPTRIGKREGIPVVLMEAMSCGIPVVASRLSGIPELVADGVNGLLVEPGRPDQLASALRALARDGGLRARLGAAGRERVCREFDLDRTAGTLAAAFARSAAA